MRRRVKTLRVVSNRLETSVCRATDGFRTHASPLVRRLPVAGPLLALVVRCAILHRSPPKLRGSFGSIGAACEILQYYQVHAHRLYCSDW